MWEDEANKYGGRWVINRGRGSKLELDKLWLDVVSGAVAMCGHVALCPLAVVSVAASSFLSQQQHNLNLLSTR